MCAKIQICNPDGSKTEVDDRDVIVNDSLGTVDVSDSTGIDEEKETGDAKKDNYPTRED